MGYTYMAVGFTLTGLFILRIVYRCRKCGAWFKMEHIRSNPDLTEHRRCRQCGNLRIRNRPPPGLTGSSDPGLLGLVTAGPAVTLVGIDDGELTPDELEQLARSRPRDGGLSGTNRR